MVMTQGLIQPDEFRFCVTCAGSGWEPEGICHVCDGWGWVGLHSAEVTRTVALSYVNSLKFQKQIGRTYLEQFAWR